MLVDGALPVELVKRVGGRPTAGVHINDINPGNYPWRHRTHWLR